MPINVSELDVDLIAFTSHKIHGPKGIGALWARRFDRLRPVLRGGGQEAGLRGGTQCASLAWGFAEASERQANATKSEMGEALLHKLQEVIPEVQLVGPAFGQCRAPHICSIHLPGLPTGPLLNALTDAGVCCSAGSDCTRSSRQDFSKVLTAMKRHPDEGAFLRFSVGRTTTEDELDQAAKQFAKCVTGASSLCALIY